MSIALVQRIKELETRVKVLESTHVVAVEAPVPDIANRVKTLENQYRMLVARMSRKT